MPIYEFYCSRCNTIFGFLSRTVNTTARPPCPKCKARHLERQVSLFSATGRAKEDSPAGDLPVDEAKMERAMGMLAQEAEGMNEDDPRQAANLMRKFSDLTGLKMNKSMQEALGRLEAGEDPDSIEKEMGDLMEGDNDPFELPEKSEVKANRRPPPRRDSTLYEL